MQRGEIGVRERLVDSDALRGVEREHAVEEILSEGRRAREEACEGDLWSVS
jgi:hypothetical protein